jgi:hypothetical protein
VQHTPDDCGGCHTEGTLDGFVQRRDVGTDKVEQVDLIGGGSACVADERDLEIRRFKSTYGPRELRSIEAGFRRRTADRSDADSHGLV